MCRHYPIKCNQVTNKIQITKSPLHPIVIPACPPEAGKPSGRLRMSPWVCHAGPFDCAGLPIVSYGGQAGRLKTGSVEGLAVFLAVHQANKIKNGKLLGAGIFFPVLAFIDIIAEVFGDVQKGFWLLIAGHG